MFKRNIFKILAVVFFLLAGATFYNSNKTIPKTIIKNKKTVNKIISPAKISTIIKDREDRAPTIEPTQIIALPTNTPVSRSFDVVQNKPTNIPPTSAPQGLMISLTINGSSVGSMNITSGSNQCDVLSQALSQGKIQSLNMRYNNDMGTNAVYQINGLGKENVVWWVFKINGQSPSQGCSYIKVNNGDNILWEYLGN